MEELLKEIAIKLKGLRAENDLTLEQVSSKLNIHRETIRRYENNPKNMNMDIFIQLLNLYNTEPLIFFERLYGKMPYNKKQKE